MKNDPIYENGNFFVTEAEFGSGRYRPKSKGFLVWETGITHAVTRATIGYEGEEGLRRAIVEADKLAGAS